MSEIALEFDAVWKKFQRGEIHDSLRDLLPALTSVLFSRNGHGELHDQEFWALQDVSFQIRRGEAWGIIGANGAGKSTILKLLSNVLTPTKGKINVHGKMSALIEVGAGFHPDLTGRENVYLNGCILGMKRQEIARKFDEIVEFAGISDFIDTPVKRYSSGMYARLGFAVAAHVDPDILLVDEVLSVGDMEFQKRCLDRMHRLVAQGTTVIFVSHNLQAVQMLCGRSLLLVSGRMAEIGETRNVLSRYIQNLQGGEPDTQEELISNARLEDQTGEVVDSFEPGDRAFLRLEVDESVRASDCILAFIVQRVTDGQALCDYNLYLREILPADGLNNDRSFVIAFDVNLLRGMYTILLNLYHSPTASFLVHRMNAGVFSVHEVASYGGIAHLKPVLCVADDRFLSAPKLESLTDRE
jgi:lipopolysaccharide transport system ATP-binding protein